MTIICKNVINQLSFKKTSMSQRKLEFKRAMF